MSGIHGVMKLPKYWLLTKGLTIHLYLMGSFLHRENAIHFEYVT